MTSSTPPSYPFRSRREIHRNEPRTYSDADLHPDSDEEATARTGRATDPAAGHPGRHRPSGAGRAGAAVPGSRTKAAARAGARRGAVLGTATAAERASVPHRSAAAQESDDAPGQGDAPASIESDFPWPSSTRSRRSTPKKRRAAASEGKAEPRREHPGPSAHTAEIPAVGRSDADGADQEEAFEEETTGMRSRRLARERQAAKKRRFWRRVRSFFVLVIVLAMVGGAGYLAVRQLRSSANQTAQDDFPGPGTEAVSVTIEENSTGRDIGKTLVDAGVVKSVGAFIRQFEKSKAATSIRPGTYSMRLQMSAAEALAALLDETNRTDNTITVIPGTTIWQVKAKIADIMGVSEDEVQRALDDAEAIGLPAEANGKAEGWLLPGTYEVDPEDTPTTVVKRMVAGTIAELAEMGVADADRETVLIKASIVDGEGYIKRYQPMIARVIENRLADPDGETRGRLEMDSTVQYGVGKSGGVPDATAIADDNPYNTRLHAGLPPTPIGQPSRDAISAVVNPAQGTWLYFTTVNLDTGETLFADNFAEQMENQKKFQDYCASHEGKC